MGCGVFILEGIDYLVRVGGGDVELYVMLFEDVSMIVLRSWGLLEVS